MVNFGDGIEDIIKKREMNRLIREKKAHIVYNPILVDYKHYYYWLNKNQYERTNADIVLSKIIQMRSKGEI